MIAIAWITRCKTRWRKKKTAVPLSLVLKYIFLLLIDLDNYKSNCSKKKNYKSNEVNQIVIKK